MSRIEELLAGSVKFVPAVVCFLRRGNQVLLGRRIKVSRNLGTNLLAGIGGKVGDLPEYRDETPEEAVAREVAEEIKVTITTYRAMGRVRFIYPHKPDWNQDVTIYIATEWQGEPEETETTEPLWVDQVSLPASQMWPDNADWVPLVLAGEHVDMIFLYDGNGGIVERLVS